MMSLTPVLHLLPPEVAHDAAIWALARRVAPRPRLPALPRLETVLFGHRLPHPLGLAAGFDKNGEAIDACFRLGFAFVEIGTITPRAQAGNPKPRMFRLREQQALINRLGFNNEGLDAIRARLAGRAPLPGLLGANIGMNRDAEDPIRDYVDGLRGVYPLVDYVTVNVSSPNTPGLRELQGKAWLAPLLEALLETRAGLAGAAPPKPLLLKIAPDLNADEEAELALVALEKRIEGLIVSNTTLARPAGLTGRHRAETGGLSGPPLFHRSTELLRRMRRLTAGELALIGSGGIASGADAYAKIRAGASALQLYTAMIYQGPAVVRRVLVELDRLLGRDGFTGIAQAVGRDVTGPEPPP